MEYIDPNLLGKRSHGGVRGRKEYRRQISVDSLVGNDGRNDWFRGSCWNCDEPYFCQRREKTKSLYKCAECGKTSFMYKGFFDRDRTEFQEIQPEELTETCIVFETEYRGLDPSTHYGTVEKFADACAGDFYDAVRKIRMIEPSGDEVIL